MDTDFTSSPLHLLLKIWSHLSHHRRIQVRFLVLVMIANGAAELMSLGAILPFLAVLINPDDMYKNPVIQSIAHRFDYAQPIQLVLPATIVFVLAAALAALIRLFNLWLNGRLAAAVGSELSCECYKRTLYQPYKIHVKRNSSTLISAMTQHIALTVMSLNLALQMLSSLFVSIALFIGLIYIDAKVAFFTAFLFGTAYYLAGLASRHKLLLNGRQIAHENNKRVQALQEGVGAIRDVLLDGSQTTYLDLYRKSDRPQRLLEAKNTFLSMFPRVVLEAFGLIVIAFLGGFLVIGRGSGTLVIPLLGAFSLGAQRLLPALQQIYSGWSNLQAWNASLVVVLNLLDQPLPEIQKRCQPLELREKVCLRDVCFRYSPELPCVLRDVDLQINRGDRIGLIGSTGSGKSTVLDVLMGLLPPSDGFLIVDGVSLYDKGNAEFLERWRAAVAHVPQSIFLADASIAENIAFGVPKDQIDMKRVVEAASQAQISGFIESSSDGYSTFVGERGIRLSGGQRQRIGIARALYKQASIIIFDEATSALDTSTEQAVMHALGGLSKELTIVMVAHRLSTVERCDRIFKLDNGVVVSSGSPSHVLDTKT